MYFFIFDLPVRPRIMYSLLVDWWIEREIGICTKILMVTQLSNLFHKNPLVFACENTIYFWLSTYMKHKISSSPLIFSLCRLGKGALFVPGGSRASSNNWRRLADLKFNWRSDFATAAAQGTLVAEKFAPLALTWDRESDFPLWKAKMAILK